MPPEVGCPLAQNGVRVLKLLDGFHGAEEYRIMLCLSRGSGKGGAAATEAAFHHWRRIRPVLACVLFDPPNSALQASDMEGRRFATTSLRLCGDPRMLECSIRPPRPTLPLACRGL